MNLLREYIDGTRRLDFKDLSRAWQRFLSLYTVSPTFRRKVKGRYAHGLPIRAFLQYLGYGIYVGRKRKRCERFSLYEFLHTFVRINIIVVEVKAQLLKNPLKLSKHIDYCLLETG